MNRNTIKTTLASLALCGAAATQTACSQPGVNCQATPAVAYAAKYTRTAGEDTCSVGTFKGDTLGFASYNASTTSSLGQTVPDLNKVSLAIRTHFLGAQVAFAKDSGVIDATQGHAAHAFGPFAAAFPTNDVCTATLEPAQQALPEIAGDVGEAEDPDDDLPAQAGLDIKEEWSDVRVYTTAANIGTQVKGHYTVTDNVAGCTAEYDVLAIYPAVACGDVVAEGDVIDIASIDDSDTDGPVHVVTTAPHGLAVGDAIEIGGADDDERSYDGNYSVAEVVSEVEFITNEIDPFDGDDPDPLGATGTVQKLITVGNADYCSSAPVPAAGIAVGSGISQDYPTVCDAELFLCVLDADPSAAAFPILNK